ncbi:MAG: hypothetical protein ACLGIS_18665, partial [Actinomycetes bacterium]
MEDPTTIALNLTFFGTVLVAFLMFLGLFTAFIVMLVLAGVGRLLASAVMAMIGRFPANDTVEIVRLPAAGQQTAVGPDAGQSGQAKERPAKERKTLLTWAGLREALRTAVAHHPLLTAARPVPPVLAKDWAEAVAAADARAVARARATAPV